jgi:hypothetical protein
MQDEGLIADEHTSFTKANCTVKMRESVGYARELMGGKGTCSTSIWGVSSPMPKPFTPTKAPAK